MKKRLLSIIASLIFVLNFITTGAANAFQFYAAFTSVQQPLNILLIRYFLIRAFCFSGKRKY